MNGLFAVAAGGAIGAALRHGVSLGATRFALGGAAGATMFVNIVGGALMGLLLGWLLSKEIPSENSWWLFLGTGLLGGFTTFSAFSREKVYMIQQGEYVRAIAYAGITVIAALGALLIGLYIARKFFA